MHFLYVLRVATLLVLAYTADPLDNHSCVIDLIVTMLGSLELPFLYIALEAAKNFILCKSSVVADGFSLKNAANIDS